MTAPIVKETTLPPEPVSHDPFIDDVQQGPPPPPPAPTRRRIVD
jgi:hypothetical protein